MADGREMRIEMSQIPKWEKKHHHYFPAPGWELDRRSHFPAVPTTPTAYRRGGKLGLNLRREGI